MLPLSHDEVVHGKGSLAAKMPGDAWQKLANLRLLYGYQWALPGKNLLFMGSELAQWGEWNHDGQVDWHLDERTRGRGRAPLDRRPQPGAAGAPGAVRARLGTRRVPVDVADDRANSTLSFLRYARDGSPLLFVANFTPVDPARTRASRCRRAASGPRS